MIRSNTRRFEAIRPLLLVSLFVSGLLANTAIPTLAANFNKTGSMNVARQYPYCHAARKRGGACNRRRLPRINISFLPFTRTASRKALSHWSSVVFVVPTSGHNHSVPLTGWPIPHPRQIHAQRTGINPLTSRLRLILYSNVSSAICASVST